MTIIRLTMEAGASTVQKSQRREGDNVVSRRVWEDPSTASCALFLRCQNARRTEVQVSSLVSAGGWLPRIPQLSKRRRGACALIQIHGVHRPERPEPSWPAFGEHGNLTAFAILLLGA